LFDCWAGTTSSALFDLMLTAEAALLLPPTNRFLLCWFFPESAL